MPAQTSTALDQLLDGLTTAIAGWVRPSLGLVDAHSGKPTPPDHYGQTCAALALCSPIMGNTSKRDSALAAWMNTPDSQIDHLPFNRLALHLMHTLFADQFDASQKARIQAGIKRCRLRTRYPSNNWTLLAATCTLLEDTSSGPPPPRQSHGANDPALDHKQRGRSSTTHRNRALQSVLPWPIITKPCSSGRSRFDSAPTKSLRRKHAGFSTGWFIAGMTQGMRAVLAEARTRSLVMPASSQP